ncbi:MAG: HypC/HybG/HupF family hydrogenase formation chaperone [Thermoprotei archaeon]|nr:HypC/HybG/HupF family hydrogenase formation chaperone [Thermoprotei archaeon]
MCLGIPGVVVEVKELTAIVDFGGVKREVDKLLVPDVKPGDYVIVHAGAIISKLSREEAEKTIEAWKEVLEALKV